MHVAAHDHGGARTRRHDERLCPGDGSGRGPQRRAQLDDRDRHVRREPVGERYVRGRDDRRQRRHAARRRRHERAGRLAAALCDCAHRRWRPVQQLGPQR